MIGKLNKLRQYITEAASTTTTTATYALQSHDEIAGFIKWITQTCQEDNNKQYL